MEINYGKGVIPYDEIVQESMRNVIRMVLSQAVDEYGELRGEHHFYITFKTQYEGVQVPKDLIAQHGDEITIVLQNKFWDLKAGQTEFSVGLSFNRIPTTVVVPYKAVTAFLDPSVDFGLQFESKIVNEDDVIIVEDEEPVMHDEGSNVVAVNFGKRS